MDIRNCTPYVAYRVGKGALGKLFGYLCRGLDFRLDRWR